MFGQKKEDMRVADYVLGLMDAEESAFFEREMRQDPTLAHRVADWRDRVAKIDDTEPRTPQAAMRRRIEAELKRRGENIVLHPAAIRDTEQQDLPRLILMGVACFAAGILLGGTLVWLIFR
jgi:anti-sigma-K factor RskA